MVASCVGALLCLTPPHCRASVSLARLSHAHLPSFVRVMFSPFTSWFPRQQNPVLVLSPFIRSFSVCTCSVSSYWRVCLHMTWPFPCSLANSCRMLSCVSQRSVFRYLVPDIFFGLFVYDYELCSFLQSENHRILDGVFNVLICLRLLTAFLH